MMTIQDLEQDLNRALATMDGPDATSTVVLSRHEAMAIVHYLRQSMAEHAELRREKALNDEPSNPLEPETDRPFIVGQSAFETLCRRLAAAEDTLAEHRRRFGETTKVLKAHDEALVMLGYPDKLGSLAAAVMGEASSAATAPATDERHAYRIGSEVRLDRAMTRGGTILTGWYAVCGIRGDEYHDGFGVQIKDPVPKLSGVPDLYWIKAEDILETR